MLPRSGELFARRYRIARVLGRGAMGVVYEARHETLEQRVAIKVLRGDDDTDDPKAQRRFEREAKIAARLESPNVVKVLDVDRTESGVPYLVMELLEGRDLSAEVEATKDVPIATAVTWMLGVCDAMVLAHEAGIVHRDLKLSNVFLTEGGIVKVLDFGVASLRDPDAERSTTATVAGTPRYMAPEQLLGEAPNPASDVWAIGVMLYRILSGKFPYDAPTMAAQMLAIMDGCIPLEEAAPHVPKELAKVVTRALGRTLEERWPNVADLGAALAPFAKSETEPSNDAANASFNVDGDARVEGAPRDLEPDVSRGRDAANTKTSRRSALAMLAAIAAIVVAIGIGVRVIGRAETPRSPAISTSTLAPSSPPPLPASSFTSASPPSARSTPSVTVSASGRASPRSTADAIPSRPIAPPNDAAKPLPSTSDDGFPSHL